MAPCRVRGSASRLLQLDLREVANDGPVVEVGWTAAQSLLLDCRSEGNHAVSTAA